MGQWVNGTIGRIQVGARSYHPTSGHPRFIPGPAGPSLWTTSIATETATIRAASAETHVKLSNRCDRVRARGYHREDRIGISIFRSHAKVHHVASVSVIFDLLQQTILSMHESRRHAEADFSGWLRNELSGNFSQS